MKPVHTAEPWAIHPIYTKGTLTHWGINGVNNTGTQLTSGRIVDVPRNAPNHDGPTQEANAARIVACVNACAGLSDPTADLAALREALRRVQNLAENIMACNGYKACDAMGTQNAVWLGPRLSNIVETARAALARVEGGKA